MQHDCVYVCDTPAHRPTHPALSSLHSLPLPQVGQQALKAMYRAIAGTAPPPQGVHFDVSAVLRAIADGGDADGYDDEEEGGGGGEGGGSGGDAAASAAEASTAPAASKPPVGAAAAAGAAADSDDDDDGGGGVSLAALQARRAREEREAEAAMREATGGNAALAAAAGGGGFSGDGEDALLSTDEIAVKIPRGLLPPRPAAPAAAASAAVPAAGSAAAAGGSAPLPPPRPVPDLRLRGPSGFFHRSTPLPGMGTDAAPPPSAGAGAGAGATAAAAANARARPGPSGLRPIANAGEWLAFARALLVDMGLAAPPAVLEGGGLAFANGDYGDDLPGGLIRFKNDRVTRAVGGPLGAFDGGWWRRTSAEPFVREFVAGAYDSGIAATPHPLMRLLPLLRDGGLLSAPIDYPQAVADAMAQGYRGGRRRRRRGAAGLADMASHLIEIPDGALTDVPQFLNRVAALPLAWARALSSFFVAVYAATHRALEEAGRLDTGIQTLRPTDGMPGSLVEVTGWTIPESDDDSGDEEGNEGGGGEEADGDGDDKEGGSAAIIRRRSSVAAGGGTKGSGAGGGGKKGRKPPRSRAAVPPPELLLASAAPPATSAVGAAADDDDSDDVVMMTELPAASSSAVPSSSSAPACPLLPAAKPELMFRRRERLEDIVFTGSTLPPPQPRASPTSAGSSAAAGGGSPPPLPLPPMPPHALVRPRTHETRLRRFELDLTMSFDAALLALYAGVALSPQGLRMDPSKHLLPRGPAYVVGAGGVKPAGSAGAGAGTGNGGLPAPLNPGGVHSAALLSRLVAPAKPGQQHQLTLVKPGAAGASSSSSSAAADADAIPEFYQELYRAGSGSSSGGGKGTTPADLAARIAASKGRFGLTAATQPAPAPSAGGSASSSAAFAPDAEKDEEGTGGGSAPAATAASTAPAAKRQRTDGGSSAAADNDDTDDDDDVVVGRPTRRPSGGASAAAAVGAPAPAVGSKRRCDDDDDSDEDGPVVPTRRASTGAAGAAAAAVSPPPAAASASAAAAAAATPAAATTTALARAPAPASPQPPPQPSAWAPPPGPPRPLTSSELTSLWLNGGELQRLTGFWVPREGDATELPPGHTWRGIQLIIPIVFRHPVHQFRYERRGFAVFRPHTGRVALGAGEEFKVAHLVDRNRAWRAGGLEVPPAYRRVTDMEQARFLWERERRKAEHARRRCAHANLLVGAVLQVWPTVYDVIARVRRREQAADAAAESEEALARARRARAARRDAFADRMLVMHVQPPRAGPDAPQENVSLAAAAAGRRVNT